jgi:hypothetical protein
MGGEVVWVCHGEILAGGMRASRGGRKLQGLGSKHQRTSKPQKQNPDSKKVPKKFQISIYARNFVAPEGASIILKGLNAIFGQDNCRALISGNS